MAVTRITGSKWLVKDNIQGAKTTNAAGEGQIAAATINTYNMVDGSITPAKVDSTGNYSFNKVTTVSDVVVGGGATVTGAVKGATLDIGTGKVTVDASGNVVISGDLTVNGDNVIANTTTLTVEDKNITVAKGGKVATANGAGITVDITDGTSGSIVYDSTSASKFAAGALGSEDDIVTATVVQTLTNKTYDLIGADIAGTSDVEAAVRALETLIGGASNTHYTDASALVDSDLTVAGATTIKAVYASGIRLSLGATNDYTVAGNVITFLDLPLGNIVVDYLGN